jgi:hypothetical protein
LSVEARKRYIDSRTRKVMNNILKGDSEVLPDEFKNIREFKASFGNTNHFTTNFQGYNIYINVKYAFEHFINNTNKEIRKYLNATILPTLTNPLIVIKEIYKNKKALTFYKPFYDKNNGNKLIHVAMYKLFEDSDGYYKFKTIFELASLDKVDKIISTSDLNTVYFKFDSKNKVATGTSPKP